MEGLAEVSERQNYVSGMTGHFRGNFLEQHRFCHPSLSDKTVLVFRDYQQIPGAGLNLSNQFLKEKLVKHKELFLKARTI